MDTKIAKDISKLALEVRQKANYMRLATGRDTDSYEQRQSAVEVLEETASKIETLIAKHFIHYNLAKMIPSGELILDKTYANIVSRQCKAAIKREISKKYATLR